MTEPLSISEAAAAYGTAVADLQHPIILQQEGHPVAVIISFEEYQQLRRLAADDALRRQSGWKTLGILTQAVHQRPSDQTPEQIEAEISAASAEVKRDRHAHHRSS